MANFVAWFAFLLVSFLSLSVVQSTQTGVLNLSLTNQGKPTVARVYITDDMGRPHLVAGAIRYSRQGEDHSIVDRRATVELLPGKYKVRAEKGAEFRAIEKKIELTPGKPVHLELDVPQFYNMNERGWYSGDLHIHRNPSDMPLAVRAEELNIAPIITRHVGGEGELPPFPRNHLVPLSDRSFLSLQNQEVERLWKGHGAVMLLNTPQPADPYLSVLFPMEQEYCRQARAQGGFVDAEKPIWKNVPVNVALGLVDAVGIVNNHFRPRTVLLEAEKYGSMERDKPVYKTIPGFAEWMMDLYYSFLDCGFRIPVSAGSASGVVPSWPGYARVYVHLSGPFTYSQWFADLKAGRSVATNGPLLTVFVNDHPPGNEVAWEGPAEVTVAIEVHSQDKLDRTEIVFNGEVIRSFPGDGEVFRTAVNLTVAEPGWLVVRSFTPVTNTIRYAHSSPFYFLQNGKLPVRKPAAQKWANYISQLAASVDPADYPSREAYEKAQAVFREAESVYHNLMK